MYMFPNGIYMVYVAVLLLPLLSVLLLPLLSVLLFITLTQRWVYFSLKPNSRESENSPLQGKGGCTRIASAHLF